jgi:hypothetical protein
VFELAVREGVDFSQSKRWQGPKSFLQELSLQEICRVSQVFCKGVTELDKTFYNTLGKTDLLTRRIFFWQKVVVFIGDRLCSKLLLEKTDFSQKPRTGGEDRLVARTSSVWQ